MGEEADGARGRYIGLPQDESAASIVSGYAEDYVFKSKEEEDED